MSIEDTLATLTAGLAEDEAIARAADNLQCDSGWGIVTHEGSRGFTITPHIGHIHETESAHHAVRFGPDRALRQVEAIRKVIAEHGRHQGEHWDDPDVWDAKEQTFELFFDALAGIYTSPTVAATAQGAFGWMMRGDLDKARATLSRLPSERLVEVSVAAAALSALADEVAGGSKPRSVRH